MKKVCFITVFACILLFQNQIIAQKFNIPDKYPTDISYLRENKVDKPLIRVVYGRPIKGSNKVFGDQIPYGKLWRTGANEATEVKFYCDVKFGNKIVKAGTYVLHTIPGQNEWTIILNKNTDTWGTCFYDETKDLIRFKVSTKEDNMLDVFSIDFEKRTKNTYMVLAWETTRVDIPLKVNENLLAKI
jgi:hypothetical protein